MARVEIPLPERFGFKTTLDVYIGHINRGDHLGNESLLSLLNEARVRFMAERQHAHPALATLHWINADLAIIYKSEARHGERLTIEIAATGFHRRGCDFIYRVSAADGRLVAIAKTAMLLFDYTEKQLTEAPAELPDWLR
ncbi:MAG TPA: thioesterase family protein [Pseudomonadales bacterium]|jgi:acyl-CoA thioesterase FadM